MFELESNELLLTDPDERLRTADDLKALIQCITNRLDEIISILTRDNMRRRRMNKKCTYPPKINPRAEPINNTEEVHQMGREIFKNIEEITEQAFLPLPEGETTPLIVDTDIPDALAMDTNPRSSIRREQNTTNNQNQSRTTSTRPSDRAQHTVNFDERSLH